MKSLSKIFLLIISLGNFIYPSYKDKPLPKLPKEHHRPDQSKPLPPFFIIRFQSIGDEKADNELEKLLENARNQLWLVDKLSIRLLTEGNSGVNYIIGTIENIANKKYLHENYTLNKDLIVPINVNYGGHNFIIQYLDILRFLSNRRNVYGGISKEALSVQEGKKYILRYRKCTQNELKQVDRFKQLSFSKEEIDSYFCVEIQDIAEQQKKLKEELEKALPDMPGDLRNIIQGYVGTDIT